MVDVQSDRRGFIFTGGKPHCSATATQPELPGSGWGTFPSGPRTTPEIWTGSNRLLPVWP